MAKTNLSEVSAARFVVETQPDGTTPAAAGASSIGAVTIGTLAIGTGNAVTTGAAVASTHKVAIVVNGTTYYFLVSNV